MSEGGNRYDVLDIRDIKSVSLKGLAEQFLKYQLNYKTILCTEEQYSDLGGSAYDYKRWGNFRLRGVPLVTKKRPLKFSSIKGLAHEGS